MRLASILGLVATLVAAGPVREFKLSSPTGHILPGLTRPHLTRGIRVLSDGRVLVADGGIKSIDFDAKKVKDLARRGRGPREYEGFVFNIWPIGGDSTLVGNSMKWLLLVGDSVIGPGELLEEQAAGALGGPSVVAVSEDGSILIQERPGPDGIPIILRRGSGGRSETITKRRGYAGNGLIYQVAEWALLCSD
jgi:hypothetical protein